MVVSFGQILRQLGDPTHSKREEALETLIANPNLVSDDEEYFMVFQALFRLLWLTDVKEQATITGKMINYMEAVQSQWPHKMNMIFWEVLNQHWPNIDRFRLNKFYNLVDALFAVNVRSPLLALKLRKYFHTKDNQRLSVGLTIHMNELFVEWARSEIPETYLDEANLSTFAEILILTMVNTSKSTAFAVADETLQARCSNGRFASIKSNVIELIKQTLCLQGLPSKCRRSLVKALETLGQ